MSTLNPLFLDSTKNMGGKIVTHIELIHVFLYDGDSLYFELIDPLGIQQRFIMQAMATKKSIKYKTEIFLDHEIEIQYRFVIDSEGKNNFASMIRTAKAGFLISEIWDPCIDRAVVIAKKEKNLKQRQDQQQTEFIQTKKKPREIKLNLPKSQNEIHLKTQTKSLCKPQNFESIKFLLDDLL